MRIACHGRIWRGLLLLAILPHLAVPCAEAAGDWSSPTPSAAAHHGHRRPSTVPLPTVHGGDRGVASHCVSRHGLESYGACCQLRATLPNALAAPSLLSPTAVASEATVPRIEPGLPFQALARWILSESAQPRARYLRLSRLLI